jgi:hypothetical protein
MNAPTLHRKLEKLVGTRFDYLGEPWVLVEVLQELDSLVLRRCTHCSTAMVQRNSYGQATRRVDDTLTLPLTDTVTGGYSTEVIHLLSGKLSRRSPNV